MISLRLRGVIGDFLSACCELNNVDERLFLFGNFNFNHYMRIL